MAAGKSRVVSALLGRSLCVCLCLCFCFAFTACKKAADVQQVGEAWGKLYVQGDRSVDTILSDMDCQQIVSQVENELYQQLEHNFSDLGTVEFSEEQLNSLLQSLLEARSRIPLQVEVVEQEKKQALLRFTLGSLDISGIDHKAAENAVKQLSVGEAENAAEHLLQAYLEEVSAALQEADCSEESSFELYFIKEEGKWKPLDEKQLLEELSCYIYR